MKSIPDLCCIFVGYDAESDRKIPLRYCQGAGDETVVFKEYVTSSVDLICDVTVWYLPSGDIFSSLQLLLFPCEKLRAVDVLKFEGFPWKRRRFVCLKE